MFFQVLLFATVACSYASAGLYSGVGLYDNYGYGSYGSYGYGYPYATSYANTYKVKINKKSTIRIFVIFLLTTYVATSKISLLKNFEQVERKKNNNY